MLRNIKSFNLPEIEEKVLSLWKERSVFKKSIIPPKGKKTKQFNFWEGPPTANGRPGIHHILARSFKDVILRYKTMQGFTVPRKGGWDTHGLPVELQVEKQLELTSKKDIEKYGIAAFNQKCKESVWTYKTEWEKLTERMGYWLDMEHPYVTYHNEYIESLWWIIQQFHNKGLLYEGHKVVPWCPRCGTALSSHELAQGYKTVTDTSVFIKFKIQKAKIKNESLKSKITDDTYILSWTTTPWTLPGNVALAVGEKISYQIIKLKASPVAKPVSATGVESGKYEQYILASDLVSSIFKDKPFEIIQNNIKGKDLVGLEYEPLFDIPKLKTETSYKIYTADFVTTTDGTGVVHTAVMYGDDDYQLGKKIGLPQHHTVDEAGKFKTEVPGGLAGKFVKSAETEKQIIAYLRERGLLLEQVPYEHEYPFCWRCSTPLLYYARNSWFVAMSPLKEKLLASNEHINWVPGHIKEGRFGEWLKDVKDWNFSRERYWGTPLPVWRCSGCEHTRVIGSRAELIATQPASTNTYILMRHGGALHNVKNIISGDVKKSEQFPLTKKGEVQVKHTAKMLAEKNIDLIFCSDLYRTRQTAQIVGEKIGVKVKTDKRLREIYLGELDGQSVSRYDALYPTYEDRFTKAPAKGETLADVAARVYGLLQELEQKYSGKTILLVSHDYPLWMIKTVLEGWSQEEATAEKIKRGDDFLATAHTDTGTYIKLPRDTRGLGDLHRPYIDELIFACEKCGKEMKRVKEVADVWFDSGAMPLAQWHEPFERTQNSKLKTKNSNSKVIALKNIQGFPADYISEAVDQTRGWFYTLLATATALGLSTPYKNVICLGLIHDKNGQKMSKSKGNVVDPWMLMQKYGADPIRWYFYTVNPPGEPKNFDEAELVKAFRRFLMVSYNSYAFLGLYGAKKISISKAPHAEQVLDKWIIARTAGLAREVADAMDTYDITRATSFIEVFVDDLSRWYIRRSRRRFQKPESPAELKAASRVLAYVLMEFSKILAPFVPFFAESLYQSIRKEYNFTGKDSVHLELWPRIKTSASDVALVEVMEWARQLASGALAKRAELQLKVRQPLARLTVKGKRPKGSFVSDIIAIVCDEVNVKALDFSETLEEQFILDMVITPELKTEGLLRELTRAIQDLRQDAGYVPRDTVIVALASTSDIEAMVKTHELFLRKEVGAHAITVGKLDKFDAEIETKLDGKRLWMAVRKVGKIS